jgi:hypothetical protein
MRAASERVWARDGFPPKKEHDCEATELRGRDKVTTITFDKGLCIMAKLLL